MVEHQGDGKDCYAELLFIDIHEGEEDQAVGVGKKQDTLVDGSLEDVLESVGEDFSFSASHKNLC